MWRRWRTDNRTNADLHGADLTRALHAPSAGGRVAVLCDSHGNLPALEAVLDEVRAARVDRIAVGGDVFADPMCPDVDAALVVCGHTHMPFDRAIGGTRMVNAGSVGMPFGQPGADWLLIAGADVQ